VRLHRPGKGWVRPDLVEGAHMERAQFDLVPD
jgi:hypothetical protein